MTIQPVARSIVKAPHEREFEEAYLRQAPMSMTVRDERGREEDITLYPIGGFTFVSVLNDRHETVKQYTFIAVNDRKEDVVGIVTPGAMTEIIGELCFHRKVTVQPSRKFRPAYSMA